MIQPGEAGRTVRSFFDAYLIRRNAEDTLNCVTDTVHWVGTGKSELTVGRNQAKQALATEFSQMPIAVPSFFLRLMYIRPGTKRTRSGSG